MGYKKIIMKYHEQIEILYKRISPYIRKTDLLHSDYFSQKIGVEIYFKCENLQYGNSFKMRGVASKLSGVTDRSKVLLTASGGNHGLALTIGGNKFGMKTKVFLPENTPSYKVEKLKRLGAEVVLHGAAWDDANKEAMKYAQDEQYLYVHPFNDDEVIAGQATIAYEILKEMPDVDVIIASIGGGGLLSGISQYAKSLKPGIRVYGVETIGADSMYQSLQKGELVELSKITSIAESLGARKVTQKTFDIVKKFVDGVYTVSDREAVRELREILQEEKLLVEPAASCSLSAVIEEKIPGIKGKRVAVVLCGGNFSIGELKKYL